MKLKEPKILIYDIETLPLSADLFQLGKQFIGHKQLLPHRDSYDIITIQYMWSDDTEVKNLHWIGKDKDSSKLIKAFDKVVSKADIVIGKNSDRFDMKHVNTLRMLHNLPALPTWFQPSARDDVEKQMRKHFFLPSYSLDYIAKLLLGSGKDTMEFADWLKIRNYKEALDLKKEIKDIKSLNAACKYWYGEKYCEVVRLGKESQDKMIHYGNKDVLDTLMVWNRIKDYCQPKLNVGRFKGHQDGNYLRCKHCGSEDIYKNGLDNRQATPKQRFNCRSCKKHAGSGTISKTGKIGKLA